MQSYLSESESRQQMFGEQAVDFLCLPASNEIPATILSQRVCFTVWFSTVGKIDLLGDHFW